MSISLRDLRTHTRAIAKILDDGFSQSDEVATVDFDEIKSRARSILSLVEPKATKDTAPHAATATSAPKAADKTDAEQRAAYRRAAADKKPAEFDASILGLSHITRQS